jgi:hypothetical protein
MKRRQFLKEGAMAGVAMATIGFPNISFSNNRGAYPHLREWNKEEFRKYSEWVEHIDHSKRHGRPTASEMGAKLNTILKSDNMNLLNQESFLQGGNPQDIGAINSMHARNDCGIFPALMFMYYSYRRGLPCVIRPNTDTAIRSMPYSGNFKSFATSSFGFYSRSFRTPPSSETSGSVPVKVERDTVVPGTAAYDVNGHGLMVSKIDDDGTVRFLDAHPDKSISFSKTPESALEGNIKLGNTIYGGFRQMRLAKLENGEAHSFSNEEMIPFGFSLDQQENYPKIKSGLLEIGGKRIKTFSQFIRARMKETGTIESPIEYIAKAAKDFGNMMRSRESFVQDAWRNVLSYGPITFPNGGNIYVTSGRWEEWSSPSSDCDRKQAYNGMATRLEEMTNGFPNDGDFDYTGFTSRDELISGILEAKDRYFKEQIIPYKHSSGKTIEINLLDVEERLWDLSFDPNHPPELRWGAPKNSEERENMRIRKVPIAGMGNVNGIKAYDMEQNLRYNAFREPGPHHINSSKNRNSPPFSRIEDRLTD